MYSAVDIEGHKGHDGRYYLLDFSRTFPPENPSPSEKFSHLYKMLRYIIFYLFLYFIYLFLYFIYFIYLFLFFIYLFLFDLIFFWYFFIYLILFYF